MIIISEYQYFPPSTFISALINFKYIKFESYESYQKGGFRNRCEVLGSNGVVQLVVPLVGGRTQKSLVTEVRIDNKEDWQRAHFRTLLACYNRSAFFEYFRDDLNRLYVTKFEWLVDWNMVCLEWIISILKLEVEVGKTISYNPGFSTAEYKDFRGILAPKNRILPDTKPIYYPQVFEKHHGFIPGLSILDLVFCEGPRARQVLQQMILEEK